MKPNRRSRIHSSIQEEIKTIAWKQIAQYGTPSLSLRAIAREMDLTAPALYRYFSDRDALVTALIVDAFTSLGIALLAAKESISAQEHIAQFSAIGLAYRQWAIDHPQRYQLIFGTPIPDYQAPQEITQPAAARSLEVLIQVLDNAIQDGLLPIPEQSPGSGDLQPQIEAWREQVHSQAHPYAHYLSLIIWSRVHGLVSLEIGHQFPPTLISPEIIYQQEIQAMAHQIGIL